MTLNLQISSFINILNSTLLNFVKIRLVSHRKVDKCYLEGVLPPCISACSPPSIVHFRQTVVFFPSCAPCYPDYSNRTLACYCEACVLECLIRKTQQKWERNALTTPSQQVDLVYAHRGQLVAAVRPVSNLYLSVAAVCWFQFWLVASLNSLLQWNLFDDGNIILNTMRPIISFFVQNASLQLHIRTNTHTHMFSPWRRNERTIPSSSR